MAHPEHGVVSESAAVLIADVEMEQPGSGAEAFGVQILNSNADLVQPDRGVDPVNAPVLNPVSRPGARNVQDIKPILGEFLQYDWTFFCSSAGPLITTLPF